MCDASIAIRCQEEHLVFKGVRGKRPPVTKDDGLSRPPVLVVNLCSVFRCDSTHDTLLFVVLVTQVFLQFAPAYCGGASLRRRSSITRPARPFLRSDLLPN